MYRNGMSICVVLSFKRRKSEIGLAQETSDAITEIAMEIITTSASMVDDVMITTTASATEDPTEVVTKRITILEAVDIIISETTTKIIRTHASTATRVITPNSKHLDTLHKDICKTIKPITTRKQALWAILQWEQYPSGGIRNLDYLKHFLTGMNSASYDSKNYMSGPSTLSASAALYTVPADF